VGDGAVDTGCAHRFPSLSSARSSIAEVFRQFLLRGLENVRGEWAMLCTAHNLLKLAHATG
jgi:hypothetical protein